MLLTFIAYLQTHSYPRRPGKEEMAPVGGSLGCGGGTKRASDDASHDNGKKRKVGDGSSFVSAAGEPDKASQPGTDRNEAIEALLKITDRTSEGLAIREAVTQWLCLERVMAPEDAFGFLSRDSKQDWDTHCVHVDRLWAWYAPQFAKICGCDEALLVKPSGMYVAIVSILWHYPSFNTASERYGMVFDPSNKCLNLQLVKLGAAGARALTVDMFPMRASPLKGGKCFHSNWDFWEEYRDLATKFQYEMTRASKVRIVLGRENWEIVRKDLESRSDRVVTRVPLSSTANYYEEKAHILVVRNKDGVIQQIVLPSYHPEWVFHADRNDRNLEMARLMDVVWNFAAAIAGIDTTHHNYFAWKVTQSSPSTEVRGDWVNMKGNDLWKVRVMLGWEKANGLIEEDVVRTVFATWLSFNSDRLDPKNGSLCRQVFMAINVKTWAVNKEKGHPGLVVGRATHAQRLEKAANAKWDVVMGVLVGEWEASGDAQQIARAQRCRDADGTPWRERGKLMGQLVARKHLKWYRKKDPAGLRYEGDGGPDEDDDDSKEGGAAVQIGRR